MPGNRRAGPVLTGSSRIVVGLAALTIAACGGSGDEPAATDTAAGSEPVASEAAPEATVADSAAPVPPTATAAPTGDSDGVTPEGFSTVMIEVTDTAGEVCEVCVWLADASDERGRGLMGVTDLGPAAGMLFAFETAAEHRFYMLGTPTPLSIAWFGDDGGFVTATDMEPCLDTPAADCPRYSPGGPVQFALEVFAGELGELGVTEGSTLEVRWDTEAEACPERSG